MSPGRLSVRIAVTGAALCLLPMSACGSDDSGKVSAPISAKDSRGMQHADVESRLREAGFTNVTVETKEDLVTGWLTKDGEVDQVTIDGSKDFSAGAKYSPAAKVVVTYHTFPDRGGAKPTASASSPVAEGSASVSPSVTTSSPAAPDASATSQDTQANPSTEPQVLTVKNNRDLARLVTLSNPADPSVAKFAERYSGQRIEIDAAVVNVAPHGSNETRFDILLSAGDFDPNRQKGPNFQFVDVAPTIDLHIKGDAPDTISAGDNVTIVAEVIEFKEQSELFILKPVETRFR